MPGRETAQLAAWSLVHGFATLWINRALGPEAAAQDPLAIVARLGRMLFDE